MAFKKGQSGNPAGRKEGSKNKRTRLIEQGLQAAPSDIARVVSSYVNGTAAHSLAADLDNPDLTAKDRLYIMEKYAQYVYPKMQSTSVDLTATTGTARTLEQRLSDLSADPDDTGDKPA